MLFEKPNTVYSEIHETHQYIVWSIYKSCNVKVVTCVFTVLKRINTGSAYTL